VSAQQTELRILAVVPPSRRGEISRQLGWRLHCIQEVVGSKGQIVKELRELLALETAGQQLVLDLMDVTLVNQDAVTFLGSCEADSIKLENCPPDIREWIDQASGGTGRRRTQ